MHLPLTKQRLRQEGKKKKKANKQVLESERARERVWERERTVIPKWVKLSLTLDQNHRPKEDVWKQENKSISKTAISFLNFIWGSQIYQAPHKLSLAKITANELWHLKFNWIWANSSQPCTTYGVNWEYFVKAIDGLNCRFIEKTQRSRGSVYSIHFTWCFPALGCLLFFRGTTERLVPCAPSLRCRNYLLVFTREPYDPLMKSFALQLFTRTDWKRGASTYGAANQEKVPNI